MDNFQPFPVLGFALSPDKLVRLDLSDQNIAWHDEDPGDPLVLSAYLEQLLHTSGATLAYGGYLEKRVLYRSHAMFGDPSQEVRDIHLGVDLWLPAGSPVFAPLDGQVHSFQDNTGKGNYGPTLILHHSREVNFYSLYGHLSRESLEGLSVGMGVAGGTQIGTLGAVNENGGYPPHLHFQLIFDMDAHWGDFPGVCSETRKAEFALNCPDPAYLLGLPSTLA